MSHVTSIIKQRHLQPSVAAVGHPAAWSVGSCWRYETLFDVCCTNTVISCKTTQSTLFCDRMHSDLG